VKRKNTAEFDIGGKKKCDLSEQKWTKFAGEALCKKSQE
jgi:hypothetical protein